MKKLVLMAATMMALGGTAMASDHNGLEFGTQAGVTADGMGSAGIYAGYKGVHLGGYWGGEHTNNRKTGGGLDLQVDVSEWLLVPAAIQVGKDAYLGVYGDIGVAWQQGVTSGGVTNYTLLLLKPATSTTKSADDKVSLAGGGGLYLRIPATWVNPSASGLRLGLGYHTSKGITTSLGVYW